MTKRQFVLVVVDRSTGEFTVEGPMSDDRLWNSAVVNAQKGRPQHPMLQYGRYYAGCRRNRMALVIWGSQDCLWLNRVGLSPRDSLTKATGSSASTRSFGSWAAVVATLMVRPVCPQLRKCRVCRRQLRLVPEAELQNNNPKSGSWLGMSAV